MATETIVKNDILVTLKPTCYIVPRRGRLGDKRWINAGTTVVADHVDDAGNVTVRIGIGTITYRPDHVRKIGHGEWGWRDGKYTWTATTENGE